MDPTTLTVVASTVGAVLLVACVPAWIVWRLATRALEAERDLLSERLRISEARRTKAATVTAEYIESLREMGGEWALSGHLSPIDLAKRLLLARLDTEPRDSTTEGPKPGDAG